MIPDFDIVADKEISGAFRKRNVLNFKAATEWVKQLPYGRNTDKHQLITVFSDNQGTCSTKHALLKKLAMENDFEDIELFMGLFKMNRVNTPKVGKTLDRHNLSYLPEAHNYLKFRGTILDFTKPGFLPSGFANDLIEEVKIMPHQITEFKVEYHKKFLADWLQKECLSLNLDGLWKIREQCIADLSG